MKLLSNYCGRCSVNRKKCKTDEEFDQWLQEHKDTCSKNHNGSAGAMEPAGVKAIYGRSEQKYGLQYTGYLGDGDSKSYSQIAAADPPVYRGKQIRKLECCGHVQKRMGRRLTEKITQCKSKTYQHNGKSYKGIGGIRKLTKKAAWRMQGHYGAAIRNNSGDLAAMRKAVWAIWHHRGNKHDTCGSWCPATKGDAEKAKKNMLPDYVLKEIKPVFEYLASDELLSKCLHGGTQNNNESFHHIIWNHCPKEVFVGRQRLEIAVNTATVLFNDGECASADILRELSIQPGVHCMSMMRKRDVSRIASAEHAEKDSVKQKRKKTQGNPRRMKMMTLIYLADISMQIYP